MDTTPCPGPASGAEVDPEKRTPRGQAATADRHAFGLRARRPGSVRGFGRSPGLRLERLGPPSRRGCTSGSSGLGLPFTVAGAAPDLHRLPSSPVTTHGNQSNRILGQAGGTCQYVETVLGSAGVRDRLSSHGRRAAQGGPDRAARPRPRRSVPGSGHRRQPQQARDPGVTACPGGADDTHRHDVDLTQQTMPAKRRRGADPGPRVATRWQMGILRPSKQQVRKTVIFLFSDHAPSSWPPKPLGKHDRTRPACAPTPSGIGGAFGSIFTN